MSDEELIGKLLEFKRKNKVSMEKIKAAEKEFKKKVNEILLAL
jgi:hypothetical protein|tara:strand:+ start:67547 stop:67675 length:129 start_codon:yes stop_codon:yes gene_type:complete